VAKYLNRLLILEERAAESVTEDKRTIELRGRLARARERLRQEGFVEPELNEAEREASEQRRDRLIKALRG